MADVVSGGMFLLGADERDEVDEGTDEEEAIGEGADCWVEGGGGGGF